MEQRIKKMKISFNTYQKKDDLYRDIGPSYTVPYIRIKGQWLRKLGFEEGGQITVWPKKKKLIITVDKAHRLK